MKFVSALSAILFFSCCFLLSSFAAPWEVPIVLDGATPVTAEEAMDLIRQMDNLVLVDTRQTTQRKKGTIKGSISLPHTSTSPNALAMILSDKFTPVLFYCDDLRCSQSLKSIKKAVSYGYINIFWLRGGISEWISKGFAIAKDK
ncbi:MAG: rhodanese-like domain-containing protein [Gammaproteobacteria bacterium]|nr:rhodanese-like domain-containing protein [Gammaproteobacteria bacterium]